MWQTTAGTPGESSRKSPIRQAVKSSRGLIKQAITERGVFVAELARVRARKSLQADAFAGSAWEAKGGPRIS